MDDLSEEEYKTTLKQQQHMYCWSLINMGNFLEAEAKKESEQFYKYEAATDENRCLVFHDDAWHWAMLKIKGEQYWNDFPELTNASLEYNAESDHYKKTMNIAN